MRLLPLALLLATTASALPSPFSHWRHRLPSFLSSSSTSDSTPSLTPDDWASIQALPARAQEGTWTEDERASWVATAFLPLRAGRVAAAAAAASASELVGVLESIVEAATPHREALEDPAEKTIWQLLNDDSDRYSKIVKLIELEGGEAKKVLDDRHGSITFFAPDNEGIPDRKRRDGGGDGEGDGDKVEDVDAAFERLMADPSPAALLDVHARHGHLLSDRPEQAHERWHSIFRLGGGDDDDDDDKKRKERRRIFKFILAQVLKYHGLPRALAATDLAQNNTVETALVPKFGANDGEPLRLRLEKKLVPPSLEINFYSKVVASASDVKARNGYLHTVDKPLIPPPSILDVAFLFPEKFGILTSAVQKAHVRRAVEYEYDAERSRDKRSPVFRGAPAVTLFAPTNDAFGKLPERLLRFLFSPFGERVLAKVLAYHVLPRHVVFTEHVHEVRKHRKGNRPSSVAAAGDPSFHVEADLPTLLDGEKLHITVDKSRVVPIPGAIKTSVKVNEIEVETYDLPALNGVAHVIPEVLKPPHKHEDVMTGEMVESEWEDWESWLEAWAEQA